MTRKKHRDVYPWFIIAIAVLMAACGENVTETPLTTSEAGFTVTTLPISATPSSTSTPDNVVTHTPTPEYFFPDLFNKESADVDGVVEFDNEFDKLSAETYLLYLNDRYFQDRGESVTDLRYVTLDGVNRGTILTVRRQVDHIEIVGSPYAPKLILAEFGETEILVWIAGITTGDIRGIRIVGEQSLWDADLHESRMSYSFSPSGDKLIWDCEPNGTFGWCWLDIEESKGVVVVPGGEVRDGPLRGFGRFVWSQNGDWFLAVCQDIEDPHSKTYCWVDPENEKILRWAYLRETSEQDLITGFRLHNNSISPDGKNLYISNVANPDGEGYWETFTVLESECIFEEKCTEIYNYMFTWRPTSKAWSQKSTHIAISRFGYTTDNSGATRDGPTDLYILDVGTGHLETVFEFGRAGLSVLEWSPDGTWIAMRSGEVRELYIVSPSGLFRTLVLEEDLTSVEFLGWLEIP